MGHSSSDGNGSNTPSTILKGWIRKTRNVPERVAEVIIKVLSDVFEELG